MKILEFLDFKKFQFLQKNLSSTEDPSIKISSFPSSQNPPSPVQDRDRVTLSPSSLTRSKASLPQGVNFKFAMLKELILRMMKDFWDKTGLDEKHIENFKQELERTFATATGQQVEISNLKQTLQTRSHSVQFEMTIQNVSQWTIHAAANAETNSLEVTFKEQSVFSLKARTRVNPSADLQRLDQHTVDTGLYQISFLNTTALMIWDKSSGQSTTIWGDPHVDLSDVEGKFNGDFKDLKASNDYTTFILLDGTQFTIKAKDDGVIEKVAIQKNSKTILGIGYQQEIAPQEMGTFNKILDQTTGLETGDVIYAGGDGNDWFNAAGELIWGDQKTKTEQPDGNASATGTTPASVGS